MLHFSCDAVLGGRDPGRLPWNTEYISSYISPQDVIAARCRSGRCAGLGLGQRIRCRSGDRWPRAAR